MVNSHGGCRRGGEAASLICVDIDECINAVGLEAFSFFDVAAEVASWFAVAPAVVCYGDEVCV